MLPLPKILQYVACSRDTGMYLPLKLSIMNELYFRPPTPFMSGTRWRTKPEAEASIFNRCYRKTGGGAGAALLLMSLVGCSHFDSPPVNISPCTRTVHTPTRVLYRFTLTNHSHQTVVETDVAFGRRDLHPPQSLSEMSRRQFAGYISHLGSFIYRTPLAAGRSVTLELTPNPFYQWGNDTLSHAKTTDVPCLVYGVKFVDPAHSWGVFVARSGSSGVLPSEFLVHKQWKGNP